MGQVADISSGANGRTCTLNCEPTKLVTDVHLGGTLAQLRHRVALVRGESGRRDDSQRVSVGEDHVITDHLHGHASVGRPWSWSSWSAEVVVVVVVGGVVVEVVGATVGSADAPERESCHCDST